MLKIERFARIEEELKKKGSLEIPSLSQMLGCSEETVRRDLRELESVGKLNRIRGGAYLSDKYDKNLRLSSAENALPAGKKPDVPEGHGIYP